MTKERNINPWRAMTHDEWIASGRRNRDRVDELEKRVAELEADLDLTRKERDMYSRGLAAARDCIADIIKDTDRVATEARTAAK